MLFDFYTLRNRTATLYISGNNVIRFIKCSITITMTLSIQMNKFFEHELLQLSKEFVETVTPTQLTLSLLHQRDLEKMKEIELIKYKHRTLTFSLTTVCVLFSIGLTVTFYIAIKLRNQRSTPNNVQLELRNITVRRESNFNEGGVTPTAPPFVNPFVRPAQSS